MEGSRIANPTFDTAPPDFITVFIIEVGVLEPGEIGEKGDRVGHSS